MRQKNKRGAGVKPAKGKAVVTTAEMDAAIEKKMLARGWGFLSELERKRAEELGYKETVTDPTKAAKLKLLELEIAQKQGELISVSQVKDVWGRAVEKIKSVLEKRYPKTEYNATMRDINRELQAMAGELAFEHIPSKK